MKRWMSLSALGLASMLLGPAATANASADGVSDYFDDAQVQAPGLGDVVTLEGEIAAIDYASGAFVLDTDDGLVRLVANPDELTDFDIGDVVRVSLVDDFSE